MEIRKIDNNKSIVHPYNYPYKYPYKLADLMLCYVENACQFTYDYGDMWEQYYTSVENNFEKTMAFIAKNNMLEHFKPRLRQCMEWASSCGWGFADTLADIYYEHFPNDD